jgi:DUF1009 family protein
MPEQTQQKIIGLIAGSKQFPFLFARAAKDQGYKVVAIGFWGDTSVLLPLFVDQMKFFDLGQMNESIEYLRRQGVTQAIMAGQINPERLFKQPQLDETFAKVVASLKDRRADTIFGTIADYLKQRGIDLFDSTFLLKKYLAPSGTLTRKAPSLAQLADFEFGFGIAKLMGGIDIGQTVVIKDKAIVAIEAMEGTDQAISRGGRIAREGAMVIKTSKPKQDSRFDVPVIGPKTIQTMAKVKANCLIIEANKTLIIDYDKTILLANKYNICIVSK